MREIDHEIDLFCESIRILLQKRSKTKKNYQDMTNDAELLCAQKERMAATRRHLESVERGDWFDGDSGFSHLSHAAANCFIQWDIENMRANTVGGELPDHLRYSSPAPRTSCYGDANFDFCIQPQAEVRNV